MASRSKGAILIVEDDLGVATLERRRLERAGHVVVMAGTAAEAMAQVCAGDVALILLDYRLPGDVDGLDFCATMREAGFDIPVILVTGFSSEATVIKAIRANVRDYVTKTADFLDYLPGAVDRILKQNDIEKQLVESEAQLAAVIDSARDAILTVEDDRRVSLFNPAAERMFGCPAARAIGKPITFFIPDGLTSDILSECQGVRANAEAFPIEVSLAATELPDRKFFTVLVRDISERKRHEIQSTSELSLLELLASGAPLPIVLMGLAVSYEQIFPGMLVSVLLLDADGRHLRHGVAPSLPEGYRKAIDGVEIGPCVGSCGTAAFTRKTVLASDIANDPLWQECRDLALSHGLRSCWSVPLLSSRNVILGTFALYYREPRVAQPSDLAAVERGAYLASLAIERHQVHQALRKNQDYLRTIFDNEPECVKLVDADGCLLEMNAAGLVMIEADTLDSIVGQSVYSLIAPEHRQAFHDLNTSVCEGHRGILEFEIIGQRGTRRWMQTHAVPFRQEPGARLVHLAITRDITDHKRLESQLRQSQKMEAIGRLAGGVAHDFNNLLTIINGYSELLRADVSADDPGVPMLEEIQKAGNRAADLTRQLLAFSRKQVLEAKVLDLNRLLAAAEMMLRRLIGEDIDVRCIFAPNLWPVLADPGQLHQVIMNLAVNGRDAMPAGGQLVFAADNVELDHNSVQKHPELTPGPYVIVSVTDTGCGMDKATLARMFEPFFTTKGPDKGTGLGLAVVYGIVKQSGGCISVSSELGQGTTFTICLPRYAGKDSQPVRPVTLSAYPQGTETILLVEDEEGVRHLTAHVLRACGYTILEADNGASGLQSAAAHKAPIDLIVTDVILPGISGKQLAEQLAARSPQIKCLFVSGYTADIITPHGVLDPGTAFLQKPFSPAALAKKVRQVLDGLNCNDDIEHG